MYDTIIIGGGIAGMTAAIYASRKMMKYEIIAELPGGEFMTSGEIENYPGIIKTTGMEFASTMEEQMKYNKVSIRIESAREVRRNGDNFTVVTDRQRYDTMTVIIATGASPTKLNVPGEDMFAKRGVSYCAICDGPLFRGKNVAIIGSGNSALEAVDFMKDTASKIYLIARSGKLRAHEYLVERALNNPKVEIIYNAETKEITGDRFVTGLKYAKGCAEEELKVSGIIIEAGRTPNTGIFKGLVDMDERGHIVIDAYTGTSVNGIYAAGDCASTKVFQYVIAAGQGCMALIKAAGFIATKKG